MFIQSEATMQSFEYIKTIFQEFKVLSTNRMLLTLDPESIPMKEYTHIEPDTQYFMTYSQFFMENSAQLEQPAEDLYEEKDEPEIADESGKVAPFEQVFKVNRESLEAEFSLTTLNLNDIKIINLKKAAERPDKNLTDEDMDFIDQVIVQNGEHLEIKKTEEPCVAIPHLAKMMMDPNNFSLAWQKLKDNEDKTADNSQYNGSALLEAALNGMKDGDEFIPAQMKRMMGYPVTPYQSSVLPGILNRDKIMLKGSKRAKDRVLGELPNANSSGNADDSN